MARPDVGRRGLISRKTILVFGIVLNLSLLGYFKYVDFFIENINYVFSAEVSLLNLTLPLAISFFTFQQIAYLVDAYRGKTEEYSFLHYSLFVTFFPQLIAGPIVHHKEMMPQFSEGKFSSIKANNLTIGGAIFLLGLIKKVVFADTLALYANPVFEKTETALKIRRKQVPEHLEKPLSPAAGPIRGTR